MKRTTSWMLIAMISVMVLVSGCSYAVDITGTWKVTKETYKFNYGYNYGTYEYHDPFKNTDYDWDGDGSEDTVTYHKYLEVTATTIQKYFEIVDNQGSPEPEPGIYTCDIYGFSYTRKGNTFKVGDFYTFTATRSGDTITINGTVTWKGENYTITQIWEKVDASKVANANYDKYYGFLKEEHP